MSEDRHTDLYEKVGRLTGLVESLADNHEKTSKELKDIKDLLAKNIETMGSLKTTVATISGGIGTVVTLAITFIWNFITGSHPK